MKKKKLLIIMVILLLIIAPFSFTLGRYVVDSIKNYIMESNKFFFNSDKLVSGGITYEVNNWGGADPFEIQFELNNRKNNILTSESDIAYSIDYVCGEGVNCSLINADSDDNQDHSTGTLVANSETSSSRGFGLVVTPTRVFDDNESVTVTINATSSSPYVQTLSATYVITVGKRGVSYQITDEETSPYLMFAITNAIDTYKVRTAFTEGSKSYAVGDFVSSAEYKTLSDTNKGKCISSIITLSWNPSVVVIDTTSNLLKNLIGEAGTTYYGGTDYINSITFPVDILSSTEVRFYKSDISQDYSYPGTGGRSVITFNAS